MIKGERQAKMMALLEERQYLSVGELTEALHFSPATIRRDIRVLVRAGYARKSYGGIALSQTVAPLAVREHEHFSEKAAVAAAGAALVQEGQTVFVAGSSTAAQLLRPLGALRDITVVTTDLQMALSLERLGVKTYTTGGRLSDGMCVGAMATDALRKMSFDIAFFSVAGVSEAGELLVFSEEFGLLLREVSARAARVVCLSTKEKYKKQAFFSAMDLGGLTHFVSDAPADKSLQEHFPQVEFLVADGR